MSWAATTRDGSLSDLALQPRSEVWDEVAAEPDLCTRLKCTFYDKCFLFKARKEAANADVVVVSYGITARSGTDAAKQGAARVAAGAYANAARRDPSEVTTDTGTGAVHIARPTATVVPGQLPTSRPRPVSAA